MREILEAHTPPANGLGAGHKGLYDTINNSLHFQLGLALCWYNYLTCGLVIWVTHLVIDDY
jgi:photosystem I P700 chlorophyll a apoprotein A2